MMIPLNLDEFVSSMHVMNVVVRLVFALKTKEIEERAVLTERIGVVGVID